MSTSFRAYCLPVTFVTVALTNAVTVGLTVKSATDVSFYTCLPDVCFPWSFFSYLVVCLFVYLLVCLGRESI